MRIGIACNAFGRSGGMEQYTISVIEALIEMGHVPVVFAMRADESIPLYARVEVHVFPNAPRWLPNKVNVLRFNRWLRDVRTKVTVDWMMACCTSVTAEVAACGGTHIGYLKAMKKQPSVFDRWIIGLERELFSRATLVVAHSEAMKQELKAYYGINAESIEVIYPPQSFKVMEEGQNRLALRRKFGLPEDKTLFLFPSSSHKRKGLPLLQRYFEKTSENEMLVVAGKPLKRSLKNVKYVGFCTDMPSLYHACDYTVMASLYEPLGMVGAESVCCGTPAILGQNLGCCEILDPQAVKTFDVSSDEDFARVMGEVRQQPMRLAPPYQQYVKPFGRQSGREHVESVLAEYARRKQR